MGTEGVQTTPSPPVRQALAASTTDRGDVVFSASFFSQAASARKFSQSHAHSPRTLPTRANARHDLATRGKPNAALFPLTGVQFTAPRIDGGSNAEDAVHAHVNLAVSAETLEEWRALKAGVGIGCKVIDRALEDAAAICAPTSQRQKAADSTTSTIAQQQRGWQIGVERGLPRTRCCVSYVAPGGPTHYDRAAWSSFNTMHATDEGFPGESTTAVWNFLGRVGGGAARIARGSPT
ncbi:hypothetical protein H4582DRAFT_2097733 [Lactarius indigo]|nr:hypothetical protein H4582DRAFT_2097733 [Lactarius indigo]